MTAASGGRMARTLCFAWALVAAALLGCDDGGAFRPLPSADGDVPDLRVGPEPAADARVATEDGFGEACAEGGQCPSGFCVAAAAGRVCSRRCGSDPDCPEGWFCRQVTNPGADVTFICVPEDAPCAGADLQTDMRHCGACERACEAPGAEGACVGGECARGPCRAGFHDVNGDAADGCEYACTVTRGGEEACDRIDNDCDGQVDEGIDTATDLAHCGGCGEACRPANAEGVCVEGECRVAACRAGFLDVDRAAENGCEQGCQASNDGVEACDRVDNDCDGALDEGFDLQGDLENCGGCGRRCALPNAEAVCAEGGCQFVACRADFYDRNGDPADGCEVGCQQANGGVEVCNGVDDDCDGAVDEAFDLQADPTHCGDCGTDCSRPQALWLCDAGRCRFGGCADGFVDQDEAPENGCEYACRADGAERCDGADNDCDGTVDEGFDLAGDVAHCGGCGRVCAVARGEPGCVAGRCVVQRCAEGFVDADGDAANGCEYACVPDGAEACDGRDNDCDGQVDEGFALDRDPQNCGRCGVVCDLPGATSACAAGRCGISGCRPGFANPDGDLANGCECRLAGAELCNGEDEDCDGRVDEGVDVRNDPENCGACGRVCAVPNADAVCLAAVCGVGRCQPGFGDADGQVANGCECAVANGGVETCDRADEDCDGRVDEGFDLASDVRHCGACGRRCVLANASPLCAAGRCRVDACLPGFGDADGQADNGCECRLENGGVERCNGGDDDCDGRIDEGFDLQGDSANCGACGRVCDPAHADGRCAVGRCEIIQCDVGFVDADGDAANGCEVDCAVGGAGVPGCDGGFVYPGLYDLQAPINYTCRDLFFGEVVVRVQIVGFSFRVDGGVLNVGGANTVMSQAPAPADGGFAVSGFIDGGCREVYQLQGQFDDLNVWRGLFQIRFEGAQCGFTDCANQAIAVAARRR